MTERVNLNNARLPDQRKVMEEIAERNECPFCSENITRYHKAPVIREGTNWIITENQWPYENTRLHLLAIAKIHAERLSELEKGSGEELFSHMSWAEQKFKIVAGAIAMRFGDITKNGATVNHLHCHLIVPAEDISNDENIKFKIA